MSEQYIWESENLFLYFAKFTHFYTLQLLSTPNIPQNYCKTGEEDMLYNGFTDSFHLIIYTVRYI